MSVKWVWRVEDESGAGPYRRKDVYGKDNQKSRPLTAFQALYNPLKEQPVPQIDFSPEVLGWLAEDAPVLFGFRRKKDAVAWFGKDGLAALAQNGYHLVRKQAIQVWESKSRSQIIFAPAIRATRRWLLSQRLQSKNKLR